MQNTSREQPLECSATPSTDNKTKKPHAMPEYIPPQTQKRSEGHFPNTENAVVELHRLLAIFLASRQFSELCQRTPEEGFDPIYRIQEVEQDEITRILLTLAVTARVVDDREGRVFELIDSDCGTLQKDISDKEVEVLDIREACNKIIHAQTVRSDVEELGVKRYLNPFIYLRGSLQGKCWRAQLDIIKFCKEYITTVCHF